MVGEIVEWVQQQLQTNNVFSGVMGVSVLAGVGYWIRSKASSILGFVRRRLVMELTVHDRDDDFYALSIWLAAHPGLAKARTVRLVSHGGNGEVKFAPGPGLHFLWCGWRPVFLSISENRDENGGVNRTISLRTVAINHQFLEGLVKLSRRARDFGKGVAVYSWSSYDCWVQSDNPGRKWSSVVLPEFQKQRIRSSAAKFFSSRDWYAERGIPWRFGFLFEGPPGTGKTSAALGLATELDCKLYVLSIANVRNDGQLSSAMSSVEAGSIVVMEDIDAAKASLERSASGEGYGFGVTLSGLLNVIDGIGAPQGRLLIMTTNDKSRLDPALIRHGRADICEVVGLLDAALACQLYCLVWPEAGESEAEWVNFLGEDWRISGASMQHFSMSYPPGELDMDALAAMSSVVSSEREELVEV